MKKVKIKLSRISLILISAIILAVLSSTALAQPERVIVSNSAYWGDVYSTLLYANLLGEQGFFLTSTPHGPILLYEIPQSKQIQVITSAERPFVSGYEALIRSKGYPNSEELIFDQANLELAKRLPNITNFIVLDSSYGYNALAVAPYAVLAKYYVLFADRRNIGAVSSFLSSRKVDSLMLYGHLDREVRTALASYNPEVINSVNNSRFENNMMIVDKYAQIGSIKQVILTNGEFIEASMMSGKEPVLFIGKVNVPDEINNYIKSKNIEIGVLIGNELIGAATTIRRQLGISVFVKFARGSRIPGGTINPVEDLDRFPMPSYQLSLSIVSIVYNKATKKLEVTYKNNVDLASYFQTLSIDVKNENGEILNRTGDKQSIFIDGGETKTLAYDLSLPETYQNLSGEIYTIYGESKTSLDQALRGIFKIETINIMDNTDIELVDLVYDKSRGRFLVTIENTGSVDVYVDVELVDLWINGEYVTVSANDITQIAPGQKKVIPVTIAMAEEDLNDAKNAKITVHAVYGERMHALVKEKYKEFELKFKTGITWWYIPIIFVIILILVLLLVRRRKRCPRCRTMNKRSAKHCKKCGHEFK
jgi:archaellum component FlaF (FlaF/FlaG flagellin family)